MPPGQLATISGAAGISCWDMLASSCGRWRRAGPGHLLNRPPDRSELTANVTTGNSTHVSRVSRARRLDSWWFAAFVPPVRKSGDPSRRRAMLCRGWLVPLLLLLLVALMTNPSQLLSQTDSSAEATP